MQFTYYWPLWAVVLGIIIAIAITVYGYLRVGHSFRRLIRNALIALRFIAISILLCCLLAPVITERKDVTPIPNLSILIDTSQSMQLMDTDQGQSNTSRMDQVNRLLFDKSSNFLSNIKTQYDQHLYRFDSGLHQDVSITEPLEPTGTLTNIATAIQEVAQLWRGQPNVGIVLITDGAHNASLLSVEDIETLKVPIYTIGVGSSEPPKDIHIQNINVSPIAYTGHENNIKVNITQSGYSSESIRVSLRETATNRLIDATMLSFQEEDRDEPLDMNPQRKIVGSQHEIELKFTPETEGNFQYDVIIPTLEGELSNANNEKTFSLKVLKSKLNVFVLEGRPRWEYAFLKRTLEKDPNIETDFALLSKRVKSDSVLATTDGYFPQNMDPKPLRFPDTRQDLYKYDVLILGDISSEHLTSTQQEAIIDFVETRGKAIIFLPSHNAFGANGYRNTKLSRILPIQIPPTGCREQIGEFSLDLTQTGKFHPMLQLGDTLEKNINIWENLPVLSHSYHDFKLRAGATTLIRKQSGQPILIFQRVGLGKSLLLTTEGIWNWDIGVSTFKDTAYKTVYNRFWAQILRWMTQQSDENRIYLTTVSPTYPQGETAKINIRAHTHSFLPLNEVEIELTVTTPSGAVYPLKTRTISTEGDRSNSAQYTAHLKLDEKGTYNIQAVGVAGNIPLGQDEIQIIAHPQLIELEAPQLNQTLLQQLAEQTGGTFLTIEDANQLPEQINKVQNSIYVNTERDLWAHPLVLMAVVGLLGTEWFLRKRIGLV